MKEQLNLDDDGRRDAARVGVGESTTTTKAKQDSRTTLKRSCPFTKKELFPADRCLKASRPSPNQSPLDSGGQGRML